MIPRNVMAPALVTDLPSGRKRHSLNFLQPLLSISAQESLFACVLGAAILLLIAAPLSAALNIDIDEAFALHTTGAGPLFAWAQAIAFEQQPPFYFVLESAWRLLDPPSIAFARLPSILFAAMAVALIVRVACRLAPRIPPTIVGVLTGVNPFIVWAAVEMRVYALVLLIGAALVLTFIEGFLLPKASRQAQLLYLLIAVVGLYTQYYIGFLIAAHFITLVILRRREILAFASVSALAALAFAPFIPVAMMHVAGSGDTTSRVPLIRGVYEVGSSVFMFVLPHTLNEPTLIKIAGAGLSLSFGILLIYFGRPSVPNEPQRGMLVQWIVSLILFSLVFGCFSLPDDPLRHLAIVAPSSLLAAYILLSSLTRLRKTFVCVMIVAFTALAATQFWSRYQAPLAKPGDFQRVAEALRAAGTDVPIATFPAEFVLPLNTYLRAAVIPIPRAMPYSTDYIRLTSIVNASQVSNALDPVLSRSRSLLLVTPEECRYPSLDHYKNSCRFIENYIAQRYHVIQRRVFRGALIRMLIRSSVHASKERADLGPRLVEAQTVSQKPKAHQVIGNDRKPN